jgi:hypothetical protein
MKLRLGLSIAGFVFLANFVCADEHASDVRSSQEATFTTTEWLPTDADSLAKDWQWIRPKPDGFRWVNQKPQIRSFPGNVFGDSENEFGITQNILKRELPEAAWQATLSATHHPEKPGQQVGLYLYLDEANHFKIIHEFLKPLEGPGLVSVLEIDNQPTVSELVTCNRDSIDLRLEKIGKLCRASYRLPDTDSFTMLREIEVPTVLDNAAIAIVASGADREKEAWVTIEKFELKFP